MLIVRLDGAPRAKERVRVTREGHAFTPERTVTFEGRLAWAAQEAMAGRPLYEGALVVEMTILVPIPKSRSKRWKADAEARRIRPASKPDWDNYAKMLDALNLIVWVDDGQIVEGTVRKFYSPRPSTVIEVRPLNPVEEAYGRPYHHPHPTEGVFA